MTLMPDEAGGADGLTIQLSLDCDPDEGVPEFRQAIPLHPGSPWAEDDDLGLWLSFLHRWPGPKSVPDRTSLSLRLLRLSPGRGGANPGPWVVKGDCLGAIWWGPQGDRPS